MAPSPWNFAMDHAARRWITLLGAEIEVRRISGEAHIREIKTLFHMCEQVGPACDNHKLFEMVDESAFQ
jgi:hypothetical protein